MESQRLFIFVGLALVSFLLYQEWQNMYGPQPVLSEPSVQTTTSSTNGQLQADVPQSFTTQADIPGTAAPINTNLISIENNVLRLSIDPKGGDVVGAQLLKFPLEQGGDKPVEILRRERVFEYIAQSGLVGADGPDAAKTGRPLYQAEVQGTVLTLTYTSEAGLTVIKRLSLKPDSYVLEQEIELINKTGQVAVVEPYLQLKQTIEGEEGSMMMPTYRGPAYSTEEVRYSKYSFDDLEDKALNETTQGGWIAMLQHYFVSAWVPDPNSKSQLYTSEYNGLGAIGARATTALAIAPNSVETIKASLFIGPKDQEQLSALSETLNLTVDYGFLWWLALPLHWLLTLVQGIVVNWGVAIVVVTVIVKSFLYPLTKKQYESMGRMRVLQPKMKALQERYAEDKQKLQQAMMEMYKKEKVNPLGGCLPLLLQMPIFIALYWVLLESVELRHAGFALWITDLSVKDPYYVLPVLMGASMFLMQKLSPTTVADPMQQKVMMFMPVMMTFLFVTFPSGLVLYWVVSNLITIAQQWMINKNIEKKQAAA